MFLFLIVEVISISNRETNPLYKLCMHNLHLLPVLTFAGNLVNWSCCWYLFFNVTGGRIVLFDRKMLRNFRKDGHNWKKKKDGKTVKEAHEHLKVSFFFIFPFLVWVFICVINISFGITNKGLVGFVMPMVCFHVVCSSDALTLPTWLFVSILGPRSGFGGFLGIQNKKEHIFGKW